MHNRVAAFLDELKQTHPDPSTRLAVVSHGGTLGAVIGAMLGLPVLRRQPFTFGNASLTEAQWERTRWRLRTLNDQHHV